MRRRVRRNQTDDAPLPPAVDAERGDVDDEIVGAARAAEEALDELEPRILSTDHGDRLIMVDAAAVSRSAAGGFGGGFEVLAYLARLRLVSPMPAIVPSARRAVMPEMKTSRPFAGTSMACEKWPDGCRILSLRICRCS